MTYNEWTHTQRAGIISHTHPKIVYQHLCTKSLPMKCVFIHTLLIAENRLYIKTEKVPKTAPKYDFTYYNEPSQRTKHFKLKNNIFPSTPVEDGETVWHKIAGKPIFSGFANGMIAFVRKKPQIC